VFPVRYELNLYIKLRRNSVFKEKTVKQIAIQESGLFIPTEGEVTGCESLCMNANGRGIET
jgi:hypothetical protein